jgi:UTP--glucose-1-phosphate uridylyltransferase
LRVTKAVITAAGRGVRLFPAADTVEKAMLPVVDRDGLVKPVVQIIAEEALAAGVEEVCLVTAPGDEERYRRQFGLLRENLLSAHGGADWAEDEARRIASLLERLRFVVQEEPLGYGHAVRCAKEFAGDGAFLLLLSDHLYVSAVPGRRCAEEVVDLARREGVAVAAVNPTREHLIGHYGTLTGRRVPGSAGVYEIEKIVEKPPVSLAELELQTPGLRAGYYLCFFGMHVLTPAVFEILDSEAASPREGGSWMLTPALQELATRERYLAVEVRGARYDMGASLGYLRAALALALAGRARDEALSTIVELVSECGLDGRRSEAAGRS